MILMALICGCMGLGFILLGTVLIKHTGRFTKGENIYKVETEIVGYVRKKIQRSDMDGSGMKEATVYYPTYRYYYNGEYCTIKSEEGSSFKKEIGDTISVLIDTQTGEEQIEKTKIIPAIIGVILIATGIMTSAAAMIVLASEY